MGGPPRGGVSLQVIDASGKVGGLVPRYQSRPAWAREQTRSAVLDSVQYGLSAPQSPLRALLDHLVFGYYEVRVRSGGRGGGHPGLFIPTFGVLSDGATPKGHPPSRVWPRPP